MQTILYLCLCFQPSACQIFPLVEVVCLGVTFGLNNSSPASELPENAANCNNSDDLHLYSSNFLIRSINIFCGIWLGLCCLAVIYQTIVFVIISKKRTGINYRQLLKWVSSCGAGNP